MDLNIDPGKAEVNTVANIQKMSNIKCLWFKHISLWIHILLDLP